MTLFQRAVAVLAMAAAGRCAELSLPTSFAAPAASLFLPVRFASQSSSVTAIQFDLQYDGAALSLCAAAGDSARLSRKTLYAWDLASGQRRFLLFGHNTDSFADGILIDLSATLTPNAPAGEYPLTLLNIVAEDPSAQAANVGAVSGVITVEGAAGSDVIRPGPRRACPARGALDSASMLFEERAFTQAPVAPVSAPPPKPVVDTSPSVSVPDAGGIGLGVILNNDFQ